MKNDRKHELAVDFRKIKQDYKWVPDVMLEEDPRFTDVKQIIDTKLSLEDKTIILLYIDLASYRKLGEKIGVSHTTIRKDVLRIKKIILEEYRRMYGNNN